MGNWLCSQIQTIPNLEPLRIHTMDLFLFLTTFIIVGCLYFYSMNHKNLQLFIPQSEV